MWTPETNLRDDGEALLKRLAKACGDDSQRWEVSAAITAILGWESIAAGLLGIPPAIVQGMGSAGITGAISLRGLSSGISRLSRDLEHGSANSVHILYAMLHATPDPCGEYFRECDRVLRDSRGSLSDEQLSFIERLEREGHREEAARARNIVGRRVVSLPFVELTLCRYLTSVWYPYDRKRFENYSLLQARGLTVDDRQGDVISAFGFTLRHEDRSAYAPGGSGD